MIEPNRQGEVWVFAEQEDGSLSDVSLELCGKARELAERLGVQTGAVLPGCEVGPLAGRLIAHGADQVYLVDDRRLAHYQTGPYAQVLCTLIERHRPQIVIYGATPLGRDLAPRVAACVKAALATDVVELTIAADGTLDIRRPVYNGKAFCHVHFPKDRLAIASVRPNAFAAATAAGGAAREALAFTPATGDDRIDVKEIAKAGGAVKDVTEADIIVSGGRALKNEDNFKILFELAKELDAAVGASRAACDAGYQPHSRQVGLTGKTVTPRLYIACGISGAIQHLAGMRGSKVIVAINTDKEAPIFKLADYGIVGDLFKVLPALTAEVRKLKG